ncbi:iron ABC transporter permease [Leeia sp. TBRC 13508]|uniref:Iron ABC transporter permease n=1 Tax=Leeia speluncae TaxID=2884804 RepID=A0ABS8DA61_9NEIS|nr:iron ABC transporter permease [Leeia speluncae]MCB6184488.1 iron ABC transporter permease [Leeia speluncae]
MPQNKFSVSTLLSFVAFFYLALMIAWPLTRLLFDYPISLDLLQDSYYWKRVGITVFQASLAACLCVVIALPVAWILSEYRPKWARLFLRLVLLPYLMPTIVGSLAILALAGPRGWFPILPSEGFLPLMWGYVFYNLGISIWTIYQALQRVSSNQISAAKVLGASGWQIKRRIIWPAIKNAVLASWLLAFLFCGTSFGVALLLGGREWATLEVEIYELTALQLDLPSAAFVALIQLFMCALVVYAYAKLSLPVKAERQLAFKQVGIQRTMRWFYYLPILVAAIISIAPMVGLVVKSLLGGYQVYLAIFQDEAFYPALKNSLFFTGLSLPCISVIGLIVASQVRKGGTLKLLVTYSPYLISSSLLALALLVAYPSFIASLCLLIAGYVLLAYPLMARQVSLAWGQLPPRLGEAAHSLGASRGQSFWRIDVPILLPAIQSGLAFAAATTLGEFAVTLFLSRPEWTTITTLIYEKLGKPGIANFNQALALSVLLLVVSTAVFYLINLPILRWVRKGAAFVNRS